MVSLKFPMTDYFPSGWFVNVHTHTGENAGHMICVRLMTYLLY